MDLLPNHQNKARPSISLAMIVKNEERNLPRILDSVKGCFDEIIIVDTGSTDLTKSIANQYGCKVYDFEWVDSFCKARNFAFSKATCDYIMWMDADDVLANPDAFIKWRDFAMEFSDVAFNSYHYAVEFDQDKPWQIQELNPKITFVRERVFKRSINPVWQYDLHEGVTAQGNWRRSYATTWSIKHLRTEEDVKADRSRNIKIIEKMVAAGTIDSRMRFYYGKELFEANRPEEAIREFDKALEMSLEPHDRLLALQYGCYAAALAFSKLKDEFQKEKLEYLNKVLDYAHQGLKLEPNRAEFYVAISDMYLRMNAIDRAVPYLSAAKACLKNFDSPFASPVYSFRHLYGEAPSAQLSKVYLHLGLIDKAKKEAEDCVALYKSEEAKQVLEELSKITKLVTLSNDQEQSEDIVISCPPQSAYPFDEEIYKTKPLGGSETALVQMAKHLKEKTGRNVKVFNMRDAPLVASSGVEYLPASKLNEWMSKNKPHTHIAWRHNIRVTQAPSYLWAHDLQTQTVESFQNFDKMLCLSEFHKEYTEGLCGVPADKIIVTRNGIDPEKFNAVKRKVKNPNKVVWMSSPDRGLDRAMKVMDQVREDFPDAELHVYYGLDNLYKFGLTELAEKLKKMMAERPWVKYHGFTEQSKMYEEVSDAVMWLHPCDFIETFCITALEMLALGIYPVTRSLGALKNTLAEAAANGDAIMLPTDCVTEAEFKDYALAAKRVLWERRWEKMQPLDLDKHSWASVAEDWIQIMGLKKQEAVQAS